jgi:hypothetical protein
MIDSYAPASFWGTIMTKSKAETKLIKGDLILTKDTVFNTSIKVNGNIVCKGGCFNLIAWNINAWNIKAGDIDAWNINAWNITASDINAWNINASDINAWDIICESRKKKSPKARTFARMFVTGRSKLERKEW